MTGQEEAGLLLAAFHAAEPVFLREEGYNEMWQRGPLVMTLPAVREWYPHQLKQATQLYRQACFDGQCPCGATFRIADGIWRAPVHTPTCLACEESIAMLINAATLELGM